MTVDTTPKIAITKTDTREIDNLRLSVTFFINGQQYYDFEDQGTFSRVTNDAIRRGFDQIPAGQGGWSLRQLI